MLNRDFREMGSHRLCNCHSNLSYYTMHKWLESFAYKTELSWWIFALAGMLALGNCAAHSKLAKLESSHKKSGGGVEV